MIVLNQSVYICGCRSGAGDTGAISSLPVAESCSKQTVSNVDLLDGLITTPPQPLGFFAGQPMMGGMSQMYVLGQQPGIVPMMPGNSAGMMQGNSASLVPNSAAGMMTGFSENMMQSSSNAMMQMNMGMSVQQQQQQQQHVLAGMMGPATPTSQVLAAWWVSASALMFSTCLTLYINHYYLHHGAGKHTTSAVTEYWSCLSVNMIVQT